MSPIEALEAFLKAINGACPGTAIGIALSESAYCWIIRQEYDLNLYVTYDLTHGMGYVEVGHAKAPSLTFKLKQGARGWEASFNPSDQSLWVNSAFKYNFVSLLVKT